MRALLSGEIDAVADAANVTPILLRHAQADLRESEERYRQIVETSLEGIFLVDAAGVFTFANGRFAELLGYAVQEIVGQSLFDFIPEKNRTRAALRLENSIAGASEETEVTWLQKDGAELWALLRTTSVKVAAGAPFGMLGMMTDRSRSRMAEEALRKSEAQYRLIVESTTDGIIHVAADNAILFVNRRLAEMLGYEPAKMLGMSLFDIMGPDVADADARKPPPATSWARRCPWRTCIDTGTAPTSR